MCTLEIIIAQKRQEIGYQKEAVSIETMLNLGRQRLDIPPVSMRRSLETSASGIIAEFKRRSPSKGWLHPNATVNEFIPVYERAGASACSVLTDSEFFGGSLKDLTNARALVKLPLLRKDFIVDEYQLYQSRVFGADAILLIASALTKAACKEFALTAHQLGLEVLLEVHDEKELAYFNEYVDMLGINNRNLSTFHTDVAASFRLIERMKAETGNTGAAPLFVSESGISDPKVVAKLREVGFRGFLIGETFMKSGNPEEEVMKYKF